MKATTHAGVDWGDVCAPLIDYISESFGALFVMYMAYCFLNQTKKHEEGVIEKIWTSSYRPPNSRIP